MENSLSCFSLRDPGGSKNTIKKINKDKSIEQKWEHFVTAPKVTVGMCTTLPPSYWPQLVSEAFFCWSLL